MNNVYIQKATLEQSVAVPHEFVFRPACEEESSVVFELYKAVKGTPFCTWNEIYPGEDEIRRDMASGNLYLLEYCSEVVGAISIEEERELDDFIFWSHTEKAGEFARVVIDPKYWGRGLAKKLVTSVLSVMRERGYENVHISVAEKNIPAQKTYQALGFESVGQAEMWGNSYDLYELNL